MTTFSVTISADSADDLADVLTLAAWGLDPFEADAGLLPHSFWAFLEKTQEALLHDEIDSKLNPALRYGWFQSDGMYGDNEYWARIIVLLHDLSGIIAARLRAGTATPDDAP